MMNLQEQISRIKSMMGVINEEKNQSDILSQMAKEDQLERNEYNNLVHNEFYGDYEKGGDEYSKIKNRDRDDIFGDKDRLSNFINMNFDFDSFNRKDWDNYWILSQHSDQFPEFQEETLKIIKKYLGDEDENFKYLHDRISCKKYGKQKYGTQNICEKR